MAEKPKPRVPPLPAEIFQRLVLKAGEHSSDAKLLDAVFGTKDQPPLGSTHIREARRVWRHLSSQFSGSELEAVLERLLESAGQRTSFVRIVARYAIKGHEDKINDMLKASTTVSALQKKLKLDKECRFLNENRHTGNLQARKNAIGKGNQTQRQRYFLEELQSLVRHEKKSKPSAKMLAQMKPDDLGGIIIRWLKQEKSKRTKTSQIGKAPKKG